MDRKALKSRPGAPVPGLTLVLALGGVLELGSVLGLGAVLALGLSGCYAHDVASHPGAASDRTAAKTTLLRSMRGRYEITRAGEHIGEERFTITSSASVWRAEGTIAIESPVEQRQHYVLEIDPHTREPVAFELSFELAGEVQHSQGKRTKDEYFEIASVTIAGERSRKVPYGTGTVIDLGSPITTTLVLSLLGPSLVVKKPVSVRTIVITMPLLEPAVMLFAYELHARDAGEAKIAVSTVAGGRPTAMWVRPDGLPVRVRAWSGRGEAFELKLVEGGE